MPTVSLPAWQKHTHEQGVSGSGATLEGHPAATTSLRTAQGRFPQLCKRKDSRGVSEVHNKPPGLVEAFLHTSVLQLLLDSNRIQSSKESHTR